MGGILDQSSAVQRYLYISATALCIYDHLLLFDDEVRYYWKDRRSWMFALYFLYRCILVGFHFWRVYFVILTPDGPELIYTADTFVQLSVTVISLACLDGLITLRTYAITFRNKLLTTYLATLALTRFVISVTGFMIFQSHRLQIATVSFGTTFDISAFSIVVWYVCRNKHTLKTSGLVRTIVAQATIYFIITVVVQIFSQVALNFTKNDYFETLSFGVYGLIYPPLITRFVLSLRKSADPGGGQERTLEHLTSIKFASGPPADESAGETIEMNPVNVSRGWIRGRQGHSGKGMDDLSY